MRTHASVVAAIAAVFGGLVAFPAPAHSQAQHRTPTMQHAIVQVQNDRNVPVTIYVEHGDFDIRLGVVKPMQMANLRIPSWLEREGEDLQVYAHPEGGMDLATQHFTWRSGARLGVLVPANGTDLASLPAAASMSAVIPPKELNATTLTVDNQRAESVVMFVEQGDFDIRLGTVAAHSTATLRIPDWIVNEHDSVEIFAHPERGFDLSSQHLDLRPKEHLGLRVAIK